MTTTDDERAIRLDASLATLNVIEMLAKLSGKTHLQVVREMRAEDVASLRALGREPHPHDLEALAR